MNRYKSIKIDQNSYEVLYELVWELSILGIVEDSLTIWYSIPIFNTGLPCRNELHTMSSVI